MQNIPWRGIVLAFLIAPLSNAFASHDFGHGRVNMRGSILETACAIAMDSRSQQVEMGNIPLGEIVRNQRSFAIPFKIKLINCVLERLNPNKPDWQYFTITFLGAKAGKNFTTSGTARGLALQIQDQNMNILQPGVASKPGDLAQGDLILNYFISLVSNGESLHPGEFRAAIKYKIDYY